MHPVKKIISGAVLIGAGKALKYIGEAIFSATGTSEGPIVSYTLLIDGSSTVLMGLGALIGVYGVLQGIYKLWKKRRQNKKGGREETPRRSRSDNAPSSRRDRPRNPSRQ
jgi:hypothetical protein